MLAFAFICLCLSFLCLVLSTFNVPVKPNLQSAGLALFVLAQIVVSKFLT